MANRGATVMTPERLARAISALREMSTYSADDLLCCLAEDPSTFQYVADLLASHDALTARVRELEGAAEEILETYRTTALACVEDASWSMANVVVPLRAALKESK